MRKCLFVLFLSLCFISSGAQNTFKERISKIPNLRIISQPNPLFKEYFEIRVSQAVDHNRPEEKFEQRIFLGFQDLKAPVVLETDGYALFPSNNRTNELCSELNANLIVVEHRFFGQSSPDSINWNFMTMKQAAADVHYIKTIFDTIFTGKWISTGVSKGGQAALAHKLYYPADVNATVVYGTAVKNKQTVYSDSLLADLSATECGKKINTLQSFIFRHRQLYAGNFTALMERQKISFEPIMYTDIAFDYILLELPYSYWQNGNRCEEIPDTTKSVADIVDYILKIVPPSTYTAAGKQRVEPAFYMFYRELGYYEYNVKPFHDQLWPLTRINPYTNKFFMPTLDGPSFRAFKFDDTFQKSISKFMQTPAAQTIFFIYGENDPWYKQTIVKTNVFVAPSGNHKSRIKDLEAGQQKLLLEKIKAGLN